MTEKKDEKKKLQPSKIEIKKYQKNNLIVNKKQLNLKQRMKDFIFLVITIIGLIFLLYPFYSDYQLSQLQNAEIHFYKQTSKQASTEEKIEIEKKNNENQKKKSTTVDPFTTSNYDLKQTKLPAVSGILSIPTINLEVPIYPTTTNLVLESGIGTLEGTALPNGKNENHTVLTGHSGLSLGKMFTNLPKLKLGDTFYIDVLDQPYAYEVDQIKTVMPDDLSHFEKEEGKDFVTLITCTPLGINSHRLLVRGHRIPYDQKEKEAIKRYVWTIQNILLLLLLGLFTLVIIFVIRRKLKKSSNRI